jgi:uncharacterized protein YebE (UPF0316 family)
MVMQILTPRRYERKLMETVNQGRILQMLRLQLYSLMQAFLQFSFQQ